jgi:hypothetical protein
VPQGTRLRLYEGLVLRLVQRYRTIADLHWMPKGSSWGACNLHPLLRLHAPAMRSRQKIHPCWRALHMLKNSLSWVNRKMRINQYKLWGFLWCQRLGKTRRAVLRVWGVSAVTRNWRDKGNLRSTWQEYGAYSWRPKLAKLFWAVLISSKIKVGIKLAQYLDSLLKNFWVHKI